MADRVDALINQAREGARQAKAAGGNRVVALGANLEEGTENDPESLAITRRRAASSVPPSPLMAQVRLEVADGYQVRIVDEEVWLDLLADDYSGLCIGASGTTRAEAVHDAIATLTAALAVLREYDAKESA